MLKTGVYRHFKGGLYFVFAFAKHSETMEDVVVYRDKESRTWIRPTKMFEEVVENKPRFELVREVRLGEISLDELVEKEIAEASLEEIADNVLEKEHFAVEFGPGEDALTVLRKLAQNQR
jgi:hypothetical protein